MFTDRVFSSYWTTRQLKCCCTGKSKSPGTWFRVFRSYIRLRRTTKREVLCLAQGITHYLPQVN